MSGLRRNEVVAYLQPIVSTASGRTVGLEALVRWQHPARGLINPGAFMSIAEATGDIVPIGRWVLDQVCRQLSTWQQSLVGSVFGIGSLLVGLVLLASRRRFA